MRWPWREPCERLRHEIHAGDPPSVLCQLDGVVAGAAAEIERGRRRQWPGDWRELLAGYRATIDWPACSYYRELMAAFPDAKVLLTVREKVTQVN